MKLSEIYNGKNCKNKTGEDKKPVISIEIFPPKASETLTFEQKTEALINELKIIKEKVNPSLVSVTYGAGGSNRENSNDIVKALKENFDFKAVMPHFTCVCSSRDFIEKYLNEIKSLEIENILALRGDEPQNIEVCYRDFKFAYELVDFIKKKTDFEIAVAGYPEKHIKAANMEEDIENLKKKIERGGSVIFTQLFFENENFYKYLEILDKNGINIPVAAGILPVISYEGLQRMVSISGVKLPLKAKNLFERYKDSKQDTIKAGIEWAGEQTLDLIQNKVCGIHFYTLNKAHSVVEIVKNI